MKINLLEAVRKNVLTFGDEVRFSGSILPPNSAVTVKSEESGYDNIQYFFRQSNKFYFAGIENDGSFRFIATRSTDSKIILQGETGFENGLSIMNKICSDLYSNKSLGIFSMPLDKEEFTKYFVGEYEKNFIGNVTSRGEAFLATPYISKEKHENDLSTMSYGFKCFLGDVELVNGTSEYMKKLGIVPTIKMYLPEHICFDENIEYVPLLEAKSL